MKITSKAQAGSLESSDCLVTVEPLASETVDVSFTSTVDKQFHDLINSDINEIIMELKAVGFKLILEDRGSLPFALKARVKTALNRAAK